VASVAVAAAASPSAGEPDSTIDSSTSSLRHPSIVPRSLGSKIAGVALVVASGVAIWSLSRRDHVESPPAVASSSTPIASLSSASASATAPATIERHVEVHVQPPNASVEVDDVAAVVTNGTVNVVGDLGSVHKIRLRAGAREATVEVIVAEDGARPRIASMNDLHPASTLPPAPPSPALRRTVTPPSPAQTTSTPQPAKSAARFDTQFE